MTTKTLWQQGDPFVFAANRGRTKGVFIQYTPTEPGVALIALQEDSNISLSGWKLGYLYVHDLEQP